MLPGATHKNTATTTNNNVIIIVSLHQLTSPYTIKVDEQEEYLSLRNVFGLFVSFVLFLSFVVCNAYRRWIEAIHRHYRNTPLGY